MQLIIIIAIWLVLCLFGLEARALENDVVWGDRAANIAVSSDGLTVTGTTGGFGSARASIGRSTDKRAFEIEILSSAGSSRYGVGDGSFALTSYLGTSANALGVWNLNISPLTGSFAKLGADSSPPQVAGTRYQVLIDFGVKKGWLRHNGNYRTDGADPSTGGGADFSFSGTGPLFPSVSSYNPGDSMKLRTKLADFASALPSGFISWASEDGTPPPPPPPPPPAGQAGVGLLGDSITWFMDQSPHASADILSFSPTFNGGVGSSTTAGMLMRLPDLIALKPKAIFILGGVNDYPLGLPRQTTVDNIVEMVAMCLAAGVIPYVEAILHVAWNYPNYGGSAVMNAEISARNAMIRSALLPLKGGQWINWGGALSSGDWLGDGIHLTASGYVKMNAALAAYINLYR